MLNYWCFVILFVCCKCYNFENNVGVWKKPNYHKGPYIIRPCPHFELDCIRAYFNEHSSCVVSYGPVPDPLMIPKYKFYLPHANNTYELHNTNIGGLNGKIVEFYINKKTHKLVLAAEMKEVTVESARTIAKYAQKAKEPIELDDNASGNYGTITFTTVFPDYTNLHLSKAETSSYIEDSNMKYYIGPKMSTSLVPAVHEMFDDIRKNLGLDLQEAFVLLGPLFMGNYIQHNICDFGMKHEDFLSIVMNFS